MSSVTTLQIPMVIILNNGLFSALIFFICQMPLYISWLTQSVHYANSSIAIAMTKCRLYSPWSSAAAVVLWLSPWPDVADIANSDPLRSELLLTGFQRNGTASPHLKSFIEHWNMFGFFRFIYAILFFHLSNWHNYILEPTLLCVSLLSMFQGATLLSITLCTTTFMYSI